MGSKPKVVVTRKLPEAVQARLRRDYDPHFNADDHVYSTDELMALADGADALSFRTAVQRGNCALTGLG